jgi:hypothetical protein
MTGFASIDANNDIPEPGSFALLVLAAPMLIKRRRR